MATVINPKKVSDGSGRDTYIDHASEVKMGRELLGTVSSVKPFKHWELRTPLSPGRSMSNGPTIADVMKKRSGSNRRGGKGWLPSLHMDDQRRAQETLAYTMHAASLTASSAGCHGRVQLAPLDAPSAMMQDLGMKQPLSLSRTWGTSPRSTRGAPSIAPIRPTDFATAARATQRSEPGSPKARSARTEFAVRSTTDSSSWKPVGP